MNMKILLTALMTATVMLFVSCDPTATNFGQPSEEDLQAVNDNNNVEKGMVNIMAATNPYGIDEDLSGKKAMDGTSPDVSWYDHDKFIVLIDYSNVPNCSGSMLVDFSDDPLNHSLNSLAATITINNLNLGSTLYSGTLNFTMAVDSSVYSFTIATPEGEFFHADSATWAGTRSLAWVEGYGTPLLKDDDIYQVTGQAHGVTSNGSSYTSVIEDPLINSPACDYTEAGQITITNNVDTDNQAALSLTFNVDENGNEIEATCNKWVKLHYVTTNLNITQIVDIDNL